jgi:diacylglycerol kinase (ATP)
MPPRPALEPASHPAHPARPALTVVAREVELVVNARASGNGDAGAATAALVAAGARVRAHVTADEAELAAVVRGAEGRRLVLLGGDGTVHALANLGGAAAPAAALLPAGRANNIARALGIPLDWRAAAELAVRGRPAAVDALRVVTPERTLFAVEGVSAGFHAAARHRYTGTNSGDLAAGVRALAAELLAFRRRELAVRADGAPLFRGPAAQVFLSNLPFFGFGFRVDPMADPFDGRLEAIVLDAATRRDVVRLLAAARDGRHLAHSEVTWARARRVELAAPLPLVADAEPLGTTTATVTIAPGHLHLVAGRAMAPRTGEGNTDAPDRRRRAAASAVPTDPIAGGAAVSSFAAEARS